MAASWNSPGNLAAIKRGEVRIQLVKDVTFFIESIEDEVERAFSWNVYLACQFSGAKWDYTDEGIRPVQIALK